MKMYKSARTEGGHDQEFLETLNAIKDQLKWLNMQIREMREAWNDERIIKEQRQKESTHK